MKDWDNSTSFSPGTAALPASEVEITISCRGLQRKDLLSKSDPMVVTFHKIFGDNRWLELSRTEGIENCHDPDFTRKVILPYHFEEEQPLMFKVFDLDAETDDLSKHDFLGMAVCTLGQLISKGKVKMPLSGLENEYKVDGNFGTIILSVEELAVVRDNVRLEFEGRRFEKKCFFGKRDPFLVITKVIESGDYVVVYKTEVQRATLNPKWKRFTLPVRNLCNGDVDRTIKVECYEYNGTGKLILIGDFETTLRDLSDGPCPRNIYRLINKEKKEKKHNYSDSGEIALTFFQMQRINSFMEYIKGGTQLHCTFAIDFTGSNGDPNTPYSLHYIGKEPNSYEIAIRAVGSIIQHYSSDKDFAVLGFGARLPPDGRRILFPGVLKAYHHCIRKVQLYGPTNFCPVINHVARFAATYRDGSHYFILLIMTDGVITDMNKTVQAIVDASCLPMSIIIVGVGSADFSTMEELDSDTTPLTAPNGTRCIRDIVQFVPLRNFLDHGIDAQTAQVRLAKEVLAEVPTQFLTYMIPNKILPKPVPEGSEAVFLPPDPELL
ncbi:copine-8-like [Ischnura elegans]|uniref:copine-8-like n=1 Tax=Ischnura elegans TaxID=197161 RepID=UPI001ED8857E|nr:copine-8-like [Ischnura elegans]